MRDENEIVISELRRQAKGMLPLMLITYGVFALLGYWQWQTALSILLGSAYALFNFYQIGQSALRAATFYRTPERAQRGMVRGYLTRYVLTAVVIVVSFKLPWLNPAAVIVPLFYTKIILLILNTCRKGGN